MNELLVKKDINKKITKAQFAEDVVCLFQNLKETYGMYDYFGDDKFQAAKQEILDGLEKEYEFEKAVLHIKEALSFVKDGHFFVGVPKPSEQKYSYAVRYGMYHGVAMIDCKKFYYESEEEKEQLENLAKKAGEYKNMEPLILDFRDNAGGSTVYIYDFLVELIGQEIGYSMKFCQRYSGLFRDFLKMRKIENIPDEQEEWQEECCPKVLNQKPIYVLFNENTASAAEEGIAFLRNIENVTLVGDHTRGCVSSGNCINIYLPNSHLNAYFGTGIVLYDGYRNIDAEGGFRGDISFSDFEQLIRKIK